MKKMASTHTREISFIYPWSPPQFVVLLASTYVVQSHFVRARSNREDAAMTFSSNEPR
jgi:hypothetical protein